MSTSCLAVKKDSHLVWLCKRNRAGVNVQTIRHDQEVNGISPTDLLHLKQFAQGEARIPHDSYANRFSQFFWYGRSTDTQIVLQKKEVALVDPVNLSGGKEAVKRSQRLGRGLSRRDTP